MSNPQASTIPERNPVTNRIHRKEVLRQITIPLLIGAAIIITVAVLTVVVGDLDTSKLADAALIWLILPAMATGMVFLALLGAFVYVIIWLIRNIPVYTRKAQTILVSVSSAIHNLSDKVVEPFIRLQSFFAAVRAIRRR